MSAATEQELEHDIIEGTASGEDPDAGKIFDVPRVKVVVDETDPTVLKLAFAGSVDLDRAIASDVELYNSLRAGKEADLRISVHVAGAKTTHRRDGEGDVDAVVQTKSLVVHTVTVDD